MKLLINSDKLDIDEVEEFNFKARALLFDDDNQVLIARYSDVILLPGGSIEENETVHEAIVRKLSKETGKKYEIDDFDILATVKHFQKKYPMIDGTTKNRLVQTYYFIGKYKGVLKDLANLTENEKNGNFKLELVPIDDLEDIIIENKNDNPRNIYFQKELIEVIRFYKEKQKGYKGKTIKLIYN